VSEFNFNIYGSSHGEKIGVTINGIAKGEIIDLIELQNYVNRRKSVNEVYSTARREPDIIEVISGIVGGKTDGNTVEIIIKNTNQNSKDYSDLKHLPRPSHADYPAYVKYNGQLDMSGGSFFSGRMTAPLVIAGGIAVQILNRKGIKFASYVSEIGGILQHTYKNTTTIHDARCTMHDARQYN
jgi:chorismate synthase